MTKIIYYCTRCATDLGVSDFDCGACGRETIDANRVVYLQENPRRQGRSRKSGAAALVSVARPRPATPESRH